MNLFEIMGPNKTENLGTVGIDQKNESSPMTGGQLARFLVASALLAAALVVIYSSSRKGLLYLGLGAYLVASYFIKAKPNTSDLGMLGGLVDHPFKYTDDVNRALLFLKIALAPGKFVSRSIVDGFRAGRGRRGVPENPS
ncbi:MAG TPA: hypothetical protein PK625_01710 [Spirochaetales bacterium]|nr:hypothetical protein [Spirochaetales bacterium]